MDKIIEFTNKYNKKNITFMYSTPSAYIDAIRAENISYPVKYDDGFPYSDWSLDYWTGYFSSRPTKKRETREYGSRMRAAQKLFATAGDRQDALKVQNDMMDWLGVL
jgi:hypothetical protein